MKPIIVSVTLALLHGLGAAAPTANTEIDDYNPTRDDSNNWQSVGSREDERNVPRKRRDSGRGSVGADGTRVTGVMPDGTRVTKRGEGGAWDPFAWEPKRADAGDETDGTRVTRSD